MTFYMRAKNPGLWQVQLKRKTDNIIMTYTFKVGTNWREYRASFTDFKRESNVPPNAEKNDLQQWIRFVDLTGNKYKSNTVWLDEIFIQR